MEPCRFQRRLTRECPLSRATASEENNAEDSLFMTKFICPFQIHVLDDDSQFFPPVYDVPVAVCSDFMPDPVHCIIFLLYCLSRYQVFS